MSLSRKPLAKQDFAKGEAGPAPAGLAGRDLSLVRSRLIDWYESRKRDLPWRRTKDPYAIWVSEVMLQQTQVKTVLGYYERWMERFPSVEALACFW